MKSKISLLILLLFINISLTIYVMYKCFNNKIIEGNALTNAARDARRRAERAVNDAKKKAEEAKREAERIAEEAKRESERIAEEARQALQRFILASFEKLVSPIDRFFLTLQNTTSLLRQDYDTDVIVNSDFKNIFDINVDELIEPPTQIVAPRQANNLRDALRGDERRGDGGNINRLSRQAEGGDIAEEVAVQQARESARREEVAVQQARETTRREEVSARREDIRRRGPIGFR